MLLIIKGYNKQSTVDVYFILHTQVYHCKSKGKKNMHPHRNHHSKRKWNKHNNFSNGYDMRSNHIRGQAWDYNKSGKMDICILASSSLALVLFMNTIPAEFAYDDSRAIIKNPDIRPETPIWNIFFDDFWGTPLTHSGSHKSYRPICVLTFRLNYYLGGLEPIGYHLFNVFLHAIVTGFFTHLARILLQETFPTLFAGLLFASHPIHTEAVSGVVGRADILSCLFFLLAFLCYIKYCKYRDKGTNMNKQFDPYFSNNSIRNGNIFDQKVLQHNGCDSNVGRNTHIHLNGNSGGFQNNRSDIHKSRNETNESKHFLVLKWTLLFGTIVSTAAALLSKEQGITVLAICGAYDIFLHSKISVQQILVILRKPYHNVVEGLFCLIVIGTTFITFRVYFMGNKPPEFAPADNPASDSDSLLTRILTYLYLPFLNFWLLLFPKTLSFDWSMEAVPLINNISDMRNLCSFTFYSVLVYAFYFICKHLNRKSGSFSNYSYGCIANGYVNKPLKNGNGHATHSSQIGNHINKSSGLYKRNHSRRESSSSTDSTEEITAQLLHGRPYLPISSPQMLTLTLCILIIPFIPATNLFFYVGFVIAERVLYIPSMGFILLVAYGAYVMKTIYCGSNHKKSKAYTFIMMSLVFAYSIRTVIRNQDWQNEENLYRSGIIVNPAKAWGNLANILNTQGKTEEAEDAYRNALQYRANMADVHYNLGILLQDQKRYQEAIESYQMAIQCRPRLTMAHLNLGIVLSAIGKKDEAEKIYQRCSEIDITGLKDPRLHEQTKISALYNLGRLLADQEKYKEAIEIYHAAIERRPTHYSPQSLYNMLGEAYSKLENFKEAEHWYQEALHAKSDHLPAHLTMGKLLQKKGQLEEAENWFLKAKFLDPKEGTVYQHYGQFLSEIGRHNEAAENYKKASQLLPDDFELIFNTANAMRQAGKNSEAESQYRRAVILRPSEATAHMNLGAMLHYNGKLEEAKKSYLTALIYKPNDPVTVANLQKLQNLMLKTSTNLVN